MHPFRPAALRSDRLASTIAFALMIGVWTAAYTIVCPDEYDAAQDRAEVAVQGQHSSHVPNENMRADVSDLGLTRKDIHEARQFRDAEVAVREARR